MSGDIKFEFDGRELKRALRVLGVAALVIFGVVMVTRAMYTVQASEKAVVLRFGKYVGTEDPGLHFCIPFVDEVMLVDMRERTIRMPFGTEGDRPERIVNEEDVLMLTGDLNAAAVQWTVYWQVSKPDAYLLKFHDSRRDQDEFLQYIITVVGKSVMNQVVGDYSIGEVLTSAREEISFKAREQTQRLLDRYDCGVKITNLQLQRVTPPEKVKAAYAAINEADQTRDKLENEANKERNELLPRARAERDRAIREAEGYAARRRSEVRGEIDALMAQYEKFSKAPAETRQRMYLEAMEKVLSTVHDKVIIDNNLKQLLPLLDLNKGDN